VFDNKVGAATKSGYLFYFSKPSNAMALEYDWPDGSVLLQAPTRADDWVHYVTTFDGTTLRLYADGAVVDSSGSVNAMGTRDQPFVLGRESGQDNHNFLGAIDEVAIYTHPLSADDVSRHYRTAKGE
jgi:hypothetical protein